MIRYLLLCCLPLIILAGCYSEKKAGKTVVRAQATYPQVVANFCGLWYPPKEFDSTRVEYLPGRIDTITGKEIVYVKGDTTYIDRTKYITKLDTLYRDRFRTIENTARVSALQQVNAATQDKLSKTEQQVTDQALKIKKLTWWLIGLGLLSGLLLGFIVFRPKLI